MSSTDIRRSVVITGAGAGLGRELAILMARRGYAVHGTAMGEDEVADFRWIEGWYNARRRHSALAMLTPTEYEERYFQTRDAASLQTAGSMEPGADQPVHKVR